MTLEQKRTSDQLSARGLSKEQLSSLLSARPIQAGVDGAWGALGGVVHSRLTSPAADNIWPNPTSEDAPPGTFAPPGDGSSAEFDFRYNAGAGAYSGVWVRRVTSAAPLLLKLPAVPGDFFFLQAQALVESGPGNAAIKIEFLDASGTTLISRDAQTSSASWATLSVRWPAGAASGAAPAGTVSVRFSLAAAASTTARFDALYACRLIPNGSIKGGEHLQILQADSAGVPQWVFAAGAGIGGGSSLDSTPASPDSRDEEFNGAAFGAWTASGQTASGWLANAFDLYTDSTANGVRYDWNTGRTSWLLMQPLRNSKAYWIHKAVTWGSVDQVYAKVCQFDPQAAGGTDRAIVAVMISQTSAGDVDLNNRVIVSARVNNSRQIEYRMEKLVASVYTSVASISGGASGGLVGIAPYLFIQKNGNTYTAAIATADGQWLSLGSTTAAITPDRVSVVGQNASASAPDGPWLGPPPCGIDFIRFRASTLLLPGWG